MPKEHLVDDDPLDFSDFKKMSLEDIVDLYKKRKIDLGMEKEEDSNEEATE